MTVQIKHQNSKDVNSIRTNHLTEEQRKKIFDIIAKHKTLFTEPNDRLTFMNKIVAEIRTNPIFSKYYAYPMSLKEEIENQIKELLDNDIIRPSRSPYNSPVWIVLKKQNASGKKKFRMVVDYR